MAIQSVSYSMACVAWHRWQYGIFSGHGIFSRGMAYSVHVFSRGMAYSVHGIFSRGMAYSVVAWHIQSWHGIFSRGMAYSVVAWHIQSWHGYSVHDRHGRYGNPINF